MGQSGYTHGQTEQEQLTMVELPQTLEPGSASNLARLLAAGHFPLAVEVSPPIGPNMPALQRQIELLRG